MPALLSESRGCVFNCDSQNTGLGRYGQGTETRRPTTNDPDFLGSVAFLVASHLAWLAMSGRRLWVILIDDEDWWIAAFNYMGSIFFMLSAIGAYTLDTDEAINQVWVNAGTFLGALCFIFGAYLLLPKATEHPLQPVG